MPFFGSWYPPLRAIKETVMPQDHTLALATLEFLEAAYVWTPSDEEWLGRVLNAACRVWGPDPWALAYFYDAADVRRFRVSGVQTRDVPSPLAAQIAPISEGFPPKVVETAFRTSPFGFGSSLGVHSPDIAATLETFGATETFALNGLDPEGLGCLVLFGTLRDRLGPDEVALYQRLAAHLAAAYRCRRRLRGVRDPLEHAEAIFDPDGRLLDARGPARRPADRAAVTAAAAVLTPSRRRAIRDDATTRWRPRVQTRWTLTEVPGPRGDPYVVARENQASTPFLQDLTEREKQVVASAAFGRSNKEIAYELGISHSTARVLLARGCARLGVASREELLSLPVIRAMRGGVGSGISDGDSGESSRERTAVDDDTNRSKAEADPPRYRIGPRVKRTSTGDV